MNPKYQAPLKLEVTPAVEIQEKILQYAQSSLTMSKETLIPIPHGLLDHEQTNLHAKHQDLILVTQEMTFKRVILKDFTEELEIIFSQIVNEIPSKFLVPADVICEKWQIDKNELRASIKYEKEWSEISKIKMKIRYPGSGYSFVFFHKTKHMLHEAPGTWHVNEQEIQEIRKNLGKLLLIESQDQKPSMKPKQEAMTHHGKNRSPYYDPLTKQEARVTREKRKKRKILEKQKMREKLEKREERAGW
jgi:hypothetical protein